MAQSQQVKCVFHILQLLIQFFNSRACSCVRGFQFQRALNLPIESFLSVLQMRCLSAQHLREPIDLSDRDRLIRRHGFHRFLALQELMQTRFQCLYVS